MINKVFLACFLFFFLLVFSGCYKGDDDDNVQQDSYLRYFEGLTVEKDTLLRGQSTEILPFSLRSNGEPWGENHQK